jgi:hypothetical protein
MISVTSLPTSSKTGGPQVEFLDQWRFASGRRMLFRTVLLVAACLASTSLAKHKPMSQEVYHEILNNFTYLAPLTQSVFEDCYESFWNLCRLRLISDAESISTTYAPVRAQCNAEMCNCTKAEPTVKGGTCYTTPNDICDLVDRCEPNHAKCIGRFLYDGGLPAVCSQFLACSRSTNAISDQLRDCEQQVQQTFPDCNSIDACSFARDPDGPAIPPPVLPTKPPHQHATSAPEAEFPMSFKVFIAVIAVAAIVLLMVGSIAVYSRIRRRNIIRRLNHTDVNVRVAEPVKWYGTRQLATVAIGATAAVKVVECTVSGCSVQISGVPVAHRYLLLPCRCEWCGCGSTDSQPAKCVTGPDLVARYPGDKTISIHSSSGPPLETKVCMNCQSPIESIVDVCAVYVETCDEMRSDPAISSVDKNTPLCCVCLAEPVSVVALPCGHLSTCSSCAHRLTRGVARRGAEAGSVEVSSQCPKCRSRTSAMAVLDDDHVRLATLTAAAKQMFATAE